MIFSKKNHRVFILATVLLTCISLIWGAVVIAYAKGAEALHWYCVHAKDHRQPRADASLSYVENYGGYYIDHRHSDPTSEDKVVYLTFDAGYENGHVAEILDTLKAASVPGAFFILGNLPKSNPDLVRRMAEEGHLVCNHTFTHKDMTGSRVSGLEEELSRLEIACREFCNVEIAKFFRPPEGKFDREMLMEAQKLGYQTIFWSFAYADWDNQKQPDPTAAKKKILDNIHNGAVLLLHPTSATNAAILGEVIEALRSEGYRFGTLFELTQGPES